MMTFPGELVLELTPLNSYVLLLSAKTDIADDDLNNISDLISDVKIAQIAFVFHF